MNKGHFIRTLVSGAAGVLVTRVLELHGVLNFAVFMGVFMAVSLGFNLIWGEKRNNASQEKIDPE